MLGEMEMDLIKNSHTINIALPQNIYNVINKYSKASGLPVTGIIRSVLFEKFGDFENE